MIVKIQQPLEVCGVEPEMLIYNQSRRFYETVPVTPDWIKLMEGQPKIYGSYDTSRDLTPKAIVRIATQPW